MYQKTKHQALLLSIQWSGPTLGFIHGTTLNSIINSTTGQYCSEEDEDFIHRLKRYHDLKKSA